MKNPHHRDWQGSVHVENEIWIDQPESQPFTSQIISAVPKLGVHGNLFKGFLKSIVDLRRNLDGDSIEKIINDVVDVALSGDGKNVAAHFLTLPPLADPLSCSTKHLFPIDHFATFDLLDAQPNLRLEFGAAEVLYLLLLFQKTKGLTNDLAGGQVSSRSHFRGNETTKLWGN
jgi:hypothetical protein